MLTNAMQHESCSVMTWTKARLLSKADQQHFTPCCLVPAFIRWIHRDRMSLFFCLRSRYAYCRAFSTRSFAILRQLLLLPRKPFASLKTLLFCMLFPCVLRSRCGASASQTLNSHKSRQARSQSGEAWKFNRCCEMSTLVHSCCNACVSPWVDFKAFAAKP